MKPLFLIPARGGSKGVPGKNIRLLAGIPLIAHSIRHALEVAPPEDVVVTTDSEDIADVARKEGANVPFMRPAELASDTAGSREVMLHAADFLNQRGKDYDCIVLLQPTSPLRNPEDIKKAISLYESTDADMVVSVNESASNPYYNIFETDTDGYLKISKGDGGYTRRQDAPKTWEFNGAIYVIRLASLRKSVISRFPKILPLPISAESAVDIDTELDFLIASNLIESQTPGKAEVSSSQKH